MPPKKPLPKQEQRARRLEMDRKACDGELVLPHAVCEIRTTCGFQVGFVRLEKFPNYLRKKDDTGI